MKQILSQIFFSLILLLSAFIYPSIASAQLSSASHVRIDRLKINTPTTGTVCLKPVTSKTEAYVDVVFPPSFSIAQQNSWLLSDTDIPSNATAWPGIGTPLSVTGSTVRFPSSDLAPNTLYCFRWTTNTVTTAPTVDRYTGAIKTYTSSNSLIDDQAYSLTLIGNDQVTLTASVLPKMSDTELKLDTNVPTDSILHEGDVVTVTLAFRSNLSYPSSYLLTSYWNQGKIEINQENTIDVFEYIDNSASTAGAVLPIVDTVNRSIQWYIPSLASTPNMQTVTYSLRVKQNLLSAKKLISTISAQSRISSTYSSILQKDQTIQKLTTYPSSQQILISPTTMPSTPPSPPSNSRSKNTILSSPLSIQSVSFPLITSTSVEARIVLSGDSPVTVSYGTRMDALSQSVISQQILNKHTLTLNNLTPSTLYYLQIATQNEQQKIKSSIYLFSTADASSRILSLNDLQVNWYDIPLNTISHDRIVVSVEQPIGITVKIEDAQSIKDLTVSLVNEDVLGINSLTPSAAEGEVKLVEIFSGIDAAKLLSPDTPGLYHLQLTKTQFDGSRLVQQYPLKIYVSRPIQVLDARAQTPIENALITLTKYEESTHMYMPVNLALALVRTTNQDGELPVVLPSGRYRVHVQAAGYYDKEVDFELGITDSAYPTIRLKRNPSLFATIQQYSISIYLVGSFIGRMIANYRESPSALFFSYFVTSITACLFALFAFLIMITKIPRRLPAIVRESIVFFCMVHALWLGTNNALLVTSGTLAIYSLSLLILTLLLLILLTYLINKTFTRD